MTLDFLSSLPKYRAHLRPVWLELLPNDDLECLWIELDTDRLAHQPLQRKHDVALVASYMDMRTARRHGYGRIALLEHGIGQSYGGNDAHLPGGEDRDPIGLFLSPNEHAAGRDRARYPKAKVVVVGSPVLDTLPRRTVWGMRVVADSGPPVIAVTFHWSYNRVPEMRSAFEHYRHALADLAAAHQLIGHAHPQAAGMVRGTYDELGIEYEPDYRRVFERADLLIGDNTSALYEFASTGRPVVLLNAPWFRRDVSHGLRFWDAATVGVQVDEPDELLAGVTEALADRPAQRQARKAALKVVYGYSKGAGKRAAKAIEEWVGA